MCVGCPESALHPQTLNPANYLLLVVQKRSSLTKRSISIRTFEDPTEWPSETQQAHAKKRTTLVNFRFNAVAAMHDNTHDKNIDRAM